MIRRITAHAKKIYAEIALIFVELTVEFVLFIAAFFLFLFIADRIFLDNKEIFDTRAFLFLKSFVSNRLTEIMQAITFLGTHYFMIPANIVLVLYFAFIQRHRWYSIKIPTIAVTSLVLMMGLKQLFNRSRPLIPLEHAALGLSFPSGHALTSTTFYGLLIYIVWERVKNPYIKWGAITFLILLILSIGLSRVYLRVHYASDVLAGFSLGIMWLLLSLWVLRRIERYTHKKIDPEVKKDTIVQTPA